MDFLKILERRQLGNNRLNDSRFRDFAFDLQLEKLSCSVRDEFSCLACRDNGAVHYEVPPFVSKFTTVPGEEQVLAVADEDGTVSLIDTWNEENDSVMIRFQAHNNAIFDLAWMDGERKFVTVSGDQKAILWDVPKQTAIAEFKGHLRSVKSVDFRPNDNAVFATGGRDGNILIWDSRSQKKNGEYGADNVLRNVHLMPNGGGGGGCGTMTTTPKQKKQQKSVSFDSLQSVTVVLFQDDKTIISAGAADGLIKVWDLRKNYGVYRKDPLPKFTFPYAGRSVKRHGYSNLLLDSSGCRLFANCTDHVIYQFNCASYESEPVAVYHGHENFSFFVKSVLSPDGDYILSGSSDKNAYIWKTSDPGLPSYCLRGHLAEVTSVDWCRSKDDPLSVVTCSDDSKFRIWRVPKRPIDDENLFCGRCENLASKKRKLNNDSNNFVSNRFKSFKKNASSQLHSGFVESPKTSESSKLLACDTFRTPKTVVTQVDCAHHLSKRFKSEESVTTPLGCESPRRSVGASTKRPLTGKCLFINDSDSSESRSPKKLRVGSTKSPKKENSRCYSVSPVVDASSPNRSPLKNVALNFNATSNNFEIFSPTRNLPNFVFDREFSVDDGNAKKRPQCEHWLTKLANSKGVSKSSVTEKLQKVAELCLQCIAMERSRTLANTSDNSTLFYSRSRPPKVAL